MIITIARQCGCGALHVGEQLAKQLNLVLYTRQMLIDLAKEKGIGCDMDYFFNERPVDNLLLALSDSEEANPEVKRQFNKTFSQLIGDQNCIVIGRCGNSIFASRPDLVSVFLKGDTSLRVAATAREEGISLRDAEQLVADTDYHRSQYHYYYTGLTWGDAAHYDLCIDSCRLSAEQTARIIADYVRCVEASK